MRRNPPHWRTRRAGFVAVVAVVGLAPGAEKWSIVCCRRARIFVLLYEV